MDTYDSTKTRSDSELGTHVQACYNHALTKTAIFDDFEGMGRVSDLKCIYLRRWSVFYTRIDHTYQVGRPGDTRKALK